MEYICNRLDFTIEQPTVITFGKFDGLHRGHEYLMEEMFAVSRQKGLATVVFTFDIPPRKSVEGVDARVLTTNAEKELIFEKRGIDYLIECPFTEEVRSKEPADFIRWIVESLNVKCIVAGKDFHFGHNRAGDYRLLQEYAGILGYEAHIMEKVQEDGRDISSTFVREEIVKGNIEKANHLLGYSFFVKSEVVYGKQIGRKLGIPTINMVFPKEKLLPMNGVYVTRVLIDGDWYPGVSNVGCKPTIEGVNPIGVETHIVDYTGDLYGQELPVEFCGFIRPEMRFGSLEELQLQMRRDIAFANSYYKNVT